MNTIPENIMPLIEDRVSRLSKLEKTVKFREHYYRYIAFVIYLLDSLYCGTFISSYTPITKPLLEAYPTTKSTIVLTSSLFLIGNISASIFVYPLTKKLGLTLTIMFSSILLAIGGCVRILMNEHFAFVLLGQVILGIGACFVVNTILQFCFNWFHPLNRPIYLSIISIMNIFGGGIGNTIPILFVSEEENDVGVIRDQVYEYNLKMGCVGIGLCVLNLLFFRGKPPKGFGYLNKEEEEELEEVKGEHFFVESYKMVKHVLGFSVFRSYLYIYILTNTSLVSLGSLINIILGEFGYPSVF